MSLNVHTELVNVSFYCSANAYELTLISRVQPFLVFWGPLVSPIYGSNRLFFLSSIVGSHGEEKTILKKLLK